MKLNFFFTSVLIVASIRGFSQDATKCDEKYFNDSLLNKLTGEWSLSGIIGKTNVRNRVSAQWVLNHQFIELSFEDEQNKASYYARVFIGYDCISERYVIHWLDSFGGRYSETLGYGIKTSQGVKFRFEYPDGPFINVFKYDQKKESWHLHMTVKNNKGLWMIFGDEYLERKR
jgi:hypothetical protein